MSILRDPSLAHEGRKKIAWAKQFMPALNEIEKDFAKNQPFAGKDITMCVHLEAKTANLGLLLQAGGARVHVTGSNPLSTQDDVAAGLASMGAEVYAWHGCTPKEYEEHLTAALACHPQLVLDDGGDVADLLHGQARSFADRVIGATEETTTGVIRLRARDDAGKLNYPVYAVNDADLKHLFDNRYGTGESVWTSISATSNILLAGKTAVVAGYGWCGRGVASKAHGLGMQVIVTEVDPIKALEAIMDGYTVMPMDEAAPLGDFFVTVTGMRDVIIRRHFDKMKNGAILTNAGHFDVEVDVQNLREQAVEVFEERNNIEGFVQPDGKIIHVIAQGRLVNIAAGNGHPVEIMDLSFAVQALALQDLLIKEGTLSNGVHLVPHDIDLQVARYKLAALNVQVDTLTQEQNAYFHQFDQGGIAK